MTVVYDIAKQDIGKSVPKTQTDAIIDAIAALDGRVFTIEGSILVNGDFESAGDDATEAAGWTKSLGTGGTIARVDTDAYSGEWSMKFSRTAGGGNSAGDITSDQFPFTEFTTLDLTGWYMSDAVIASKITALFYDEDGVGTGSEVLAAATTIETLWTPIGGNTVTSPAGTRFAEIKIEGATSDADVSGSAWFDGLTLEAGTPNEFNGTGELTHTGDSDWTTATTADVWIPDGATTLSISAELKVDANVGSYRIRIGANNGTQQDNSSAVYIEKTSVLTIGSETGRNTLVILEFKISNPASTVFLKVTASGDITEENIVVA